MVTNRVLPGHQTVPPGAPPPPTPGAGGRVLPTNQERGGNWMHRVENILAKRPELAVGAAVVAGVVIGWLIKRR